MGRTFLTELIKEYCEKHRNIKKDYTLAKKIYDENVGLFKNLDQVRGMVRTRRGHSGTKMREAVVDKSLFTPKNYDTNNYDPSTQEVYSKILILDIETAPLLANLWGIWNQNVQLDNIYCDWFILTWAAKWLFEDKV